METAGYVTRGRDDADGRRAVVTMTEAGARALEHTRAVRAEVYGEILRRWSTEDRRTLADVLTRLNTDLDHDLDRAAEQR
jgi:DNA-binding MarR family transcriptional regulator